MQMVAAQAGVSIYVVSKALAGKTGVSERTRARVLKIASEMNYQPNTVGSLLARLRGKPLDATASLHLAIVDLTPQSHHLFRAVCKQINAISSFVSLKDFARPGFARQLHARGVNGLVIDARAIEGDLGHEVIDSLSSFAAVKLSRGARRLGLHLVRQSAFDHMWMALQQVRAAGYTNLSVALFESASAIDDNARLGAMLAFQARHPEVDLRSRVIAIGPSHERQPELEAWAAQQRGRCLVAGHWVMLAKLMLAGFRIPGDFAAASAIIPDDQEKRWKELPEIIAGCPDQELVQFRRAVDLLVAMIARGEKGFTNTPTESVIEPTWRTGSTLPALVPGKKSVAMEPSRSILQEGMRDRTAAKRRAR